VRGYEIVKISFLLFIIDNLMNQSLLSLVLSVVTLLLVAFNTFGGNAGVMKALEQVEAMKVG
jgi:hypothetical protein